MIRQIDSAFKAELAQCRDEVTIKARIKDGVKGDVLIAIRNVQIVYEFQNTTGVSMRRKRQADFPDSWSVSCSSHENCDFKWRREQEGMSWSRP